MKLETLGESYKQNHRLQVEMQELEYLSRKYPVQAIMYPAFCGIKRFAELLREATGWEVAIVEGVQLSLRQSDNAERAVHSMEADSRGED